MKVSVYVSPQIQSVIELYEGLFGAQSYRRTVKEQVFSFAERLGNGFKKQEPGAYFEISNWHPTLISKPMQVVWESKMIESDFLAVIAREFGYKNLQAALQNGENCPDPLFEHLVDAGLDGDIEKVGDLLAGNPRLSEQVSHWGHQSTALHYIAANGVESFRQIVPNNAKAVGQALLKHGSKVNAEANMYGGGQRVLGLLRTSSHPAEAGVAKDVEEVLLSAGAI